MIKFLFRVSLHEMRPFDLFVGFCVQFINWRRYNKWGRWENRGNKSKFGQKLFHQPVLTKPALKHENVVIFSGKVHD